MAERGTFNAAASKVMQASFARPSTGGAITAIFNTPPNSPSSAFLRARGWTLMVRVTPDAVSLMLSTSYMISTGFRGRARSSTVRAADS